MTKQVKLFFIAFILLSNLISVFTKAQTTITQGIGSGSNNAEQTISSGSVRSNPDILEIHNIGSSQYQLIGLRFPNLNIPQGAVITEAFIQFRCKDPNSGAVTTRIYGQNHDNAAAFSSSTNNISGRTKTSEFVDWTISNSWSQDSRYNSVDISSIIQPIVNRPGWTAGNAIVVMMEPTDLTTTNRRRAFSYENGSSSAPVISITFSTCSPVISNPVFNLGANSSRCQGAGTVSYTASANNASISYSLDPASLSAGNTINASTGTVNYMASWSGTSTITAVATGCGGTKTSTHTVSHSAVPGTPVFSSAMLERCIGAAVVRYTAMAPGALSYNYSITNSGTGTQPVINASTGEVTYASNWSGQSTITVQALGCNSSTSNSIVVNSLRVVANNDHFEAFQGVPLSFNVLNNDLCGIDPSTVTVVTQPSQGILQQGINGNFVFTPIGNFAGNLSFEYRVCNTGSLNCDVAVVNIEVLPGINADPCVTASKEKIFYIPFPENPTQLFHALRSAGSSNSNNLPDVKNITSISVPYPSTIIIYDHWEDGYENDLMNPVQSTTQIWGDGILSNGVAPGTTNDLLAPGYYVTLENIFNWNRPATTIVYDGKDKVYASNEVSITKVTGSFGISGSNNVFDLQNVKTNVLDVSKFGNVYVIPFGENVSATLGTDVFNYTGLFARAITDNTTITLDLNADGTPDVTSPLLGEGDVWYYTGTASQPGVSSNVNKAGDIISGAIISSNNKIGVDLVFGGIDNYGTRNIPLYPSEWYGNEYFTPLYSTNTDAKVKAYFVNPNRNQITINWNRGNGTTGSFVVAANGGISVFDLSVATGTRFISQGSMPFQGVVVVDDDNNDGGSTSSYDWAYTMLPVNRLSNFAKLGWAPGTSNSSANYNPIWVTVKQATTVYVKNDGNVTQGPNQSPCGAYYDVAYTMTALQSRLIKIGNDNSGAAIFNCNEIPMAIAWGQEPFTSTPTGSPAMDVGYTVDGLCLRQMVFAKDDRATTGPGMPVTISVEPNDNGFLVALNPGSVNTAGLLQPENGKIVVNANGTITYTPDFGFVGQDKFEYQICANHPTQVMCDIATVYVNVGCDFASGANIISGLTYVDINGNQSIDAADLPKSGISLNLYRDVNNNNVYNAGVDLLLGTTVSDVNGKYSFQVSTLKNVKDEFTANVISNNNGSDNWINNWNSFNSTSITLGGSASGSGAHITNGTLQMNLSASSTQYNAQRSVNLTGKSKAILSYNWQKNGFSADANEWVDVQVSNAAGGTFTTVHRFTGIGAGSGSHSFDISAYISANTTIRIIEPNNSVSSASGKWVRFDNIEIKYFEQANYLVIPASSSQVPFPLMKTVLFEGSDASVCNAHFGYLAPVDLGNLPTAATQTNPVFWPQASASLLSLDLSNTNRAWLGNDNSYPNEANATNYLRNGGLSLESDDLDIHGQGSQNNPFTFAGFNWKEPKVDLKFNITVNGNANTGNKTVYYALWFDANGNGRFTDADDIFITGNTAHGSAITIQEKAIFINGGTNQGATMGAIRLVATKEPTYFTKVQNGAVVVSNGEVEDYFISYPVALPVSILSFTAKKQGESVLVNWITANETNNKGFELERSSNGTGWQLLGFVESKAIAGNSTNQLSYNFTDHAPYKGTNYYRLKQIDLDGKAEYSGVVQLNFAGNPSLLKMYPNPAKNAITITGIEPGSDVRIDDALGKTVLKTMRTANGMTSVNVNISRLQKGIYIVVIIDKEGKVATSKLIKE